MKRLLNGGYAKVGLLMALVLAMVVFAMIGLPPMAPKAEAACNPPPGQPNCCETNSVCIQEGSMTEGSWVDGCRCFTLIGPTGTVTISASVNHPTTTDGKKKITIGPDASCGTWETNTPVTVTTNWTITGPASASGAGLTASLNNVTNPGTYTVTFTFTASSSCGVNPASRTLTTNINVRRLTLENDPWLGIDLTDADVTDYNTATATLEGSCSTPSYTWSLSGPAGAVFDPANPSGNTAKYKETGTASTSRNGETVSVQVSGGCTDVSVSSNFTVVKVNLTWYEDDGTELAESKEETPGGFVAYNQDDDDGSPVRPISHQNASDTLDVNQSGPISGENNLAEVKFEIWPANLDNSDVIELSGDISHVFEDEEKQTAASASYTIGTIPDTFWVEGQTESDSGWKLVAKHVLSGAKDKLCWTDVSLEVTNDDDSHLGAVAGEATTNTASWKPSTYTSTDVEWFLVDTNGIESTSLAGCSIAAVSGDPMKSIVTVDSAQDMSDYIDANFPGDCSSPYIIARAKGKGRYDSAYDDVEIEIGCKCLQCSTSAEMTSCPAPGALTSLSTGHNDKGYAAPSIKINTWPKLDPPPTAKDILAIPAGLRSLFKGDASSEIMEQVASSDTLITIAKNGKGALITLQRLTGALPDARPVPLDPAKVMATFRISDPAISPLTIIRTKDGTSQTTTFSRGEDGSRIINRDGVAEVLTRPIKDPRNPLTGDAGIEFIRRSPAGQVAERISQLKRNFPWGQGTVAQWHGDDSFDRTTYQYGDQPGSPDYGLRIRTDRPDGSWKTQARDAQGHTIRIVQGGPHIPTVVTESSFTKLIGDNTTDAPHTPRIVTETRDNVVVQRTFTRLRDLADGSREELSEQSAAPEAGFGDARNPRTLTTHDPSRLSSTTLHPDGRHSRSIRQKGVIVSIVQGEITFVPDSNGPDTASTYWTEPAAGPVAWRTTRQVSYTDKLGKTLFTRTELFTGATDWVVIDWTQSTYDLDGRLLTTLRKDGALTEASWACCGKDYEKDAGGLEHNYTYDSLKRLTMQVRLGVAATNGHPAQPHVYTTRAYDAAGRQVSQTTFSGGLSQTTSNVYDTAGRLLASTDAAGLVTTYQYPDNLTTVTIAPGGLITNTVISNPHCTLQNGVLQSWNVSGVNPGAVSGPEFAERGTRWTITYTGPLGSNSPVWTKTTTDFLGRTIRTERPGFGGAILTNASFYNTLGQLIRTTSPGQADTLYEYNDLGEQFRSGTDVNNNGVLDLAGPDRISESRIWYEQDASSDWWQCSASILYAGENSATPTTNAIQRTRLTGLGGNSGFGLQNSESVSQDMLGNHTISRTFVNREAKTVAQITRYPDSTNAAISVAINGLTQYTISKTGVRTDVGYDALGRQIASQQGTKNQEPRTSSSTHYNAKGQVSYTSDALSNRTTYTYDATTGRRIAVTDALSNTTYTAYDPAGHVIATWGATYPVAYEFDPYGRMVAMYTYRGTNVINSQSAISNLKSEMDRTRWLYDAATGLLTNKLYADGKGPSYTYTPAGQLATRTWARLTSDLRPLTSTYSYSPCCGALTAITYSDGTPSVSFTLDRLGRQTAITDATGTRSFTYNDALQLAAEAVPVAAGAPPAVLMRTYDPLGRPTGFTLGQDYAVTYGYAADGRFGSISATTSHLPPTTWNYAYLPGSDLLAGWSNSVGHAFQRTYEPHRDVIANAANTFQGQPIGSFAYANDALARRVSRMDQSALSLATNLFAYNARSELSSAQMGTNAYGYAYDPIGNRLTASNNAEAIAYAANALNQYTAIASTRAAPATPLFDADGNLTNDGRFAYTWDAENRLIAAQALNQEPGTTNQLTFVYDYMSRRVAKTIGGTTHRFLYDGWAMIQETTGTQTNSYVYGLDLSGSMQGAGTIGGILSASLNGTQAFYFYDANGNVSDLAAANGTSLAHYEFDPYGNATFSSGSLASVNPFRFSTKYTDDETGLLYYGYRYYAPGLGRWLNRDPLGERGFGQRKHKKSIRASDPLYIAMNNDVISKVDVLGLFWPFDPPSNNEGVCKIAIGAFHGQLLRDRGDDTDWSDVNPDSDSGKFAKERTDEQYIAVGIISCWAAGTIRAVDEQRSSAGKSAVSWINEKGTDSYTYRKVEKTLGELVNDHIGPLEPQSTPESSYMVVAPRTRISDELNSQAKKRAEKECLSWKCCPKIEIKVFGKEGWGLKEDSVDCATIRRNAP